MGLSSQVGRQWACRRRSDVSGPVVAGRTSVGLSSQVGRVKMSISWERSSKFGKHVNKVSKWDEVQMVQRISTHGVGQTEKLAFQQVDLPWLL